MRLHRSATLVLLLVCAGCPVRHAAQSSAMTREQAVAYLQAGDAQLAASRYSEALGSYDRALLGAFLLERPEQARAYFGHGVAAQELWRTAPDSAGTDSVTAIANDDSRWRAAVDSYHEAARLDSARYFRTASYNCGVLYRQLGSHTRAASAFVDLAQVAPDSERPRYLMWAVEELRAASRTDPEGAALYARATRALLALQRLDTASRAVQLTLARDPAVVSLDSTVAWLTRAVADSSNASEAAGAAIDALRSLPPGAPAAAADSLLHLVALADVAARTSPALFATEQSDPLAAVAVRQPQLAAPIEDLRLAYAADSAFLAGGRAQRPDEWWTARSERHQTWSSVLRVVGQWNERLGRDSLARELYESAIAADGFELAWWSDLDAVLPLLLYYDRAAGSSGADSGANARRLKDLLDLVFYGKASAYANAHNPRIRQFHIVLGNYYAQRGLWVGEPRGAIYQLEHMRQITKTLGGAKAGYVDPPELLEELIQGYIATKNLTAARRVLPDLAAASAAVGPPGLADRWRARLDSLQHVPRARGRRG